MERYTLVALRFCIYSINFGCGSRIYSNTNIAKNNLDFKKLLDHLNWCCQTNEHEHQYLVDGNFYEVTKQRHSVRAASRFSLNVLRFTGLYSSCPALLDLACELRTKSMPPVPNGFIAQIDTAFMQKVFYISQ